MIGDIKIRKVNWQRSEIIGQTVKGKNWIIQNMDSNLKTNIVVDSEHISDLIDLFQRSGLSVEVE